MQKTWIGISNVWDKMKTDSQKAWEKAKEEWRTVWEFDRRGIGLSILLLLAVACTFALASGKLQSSALSECFWASVFLAAFLGGFCVTQILGHYFSERDFFSLLDGSLLICSMIAILVCSVVGFASAGHVAGAFAFAGAVAAVGTIEIVSTGAIAFTFSRAVVTAAVFSALQALSIESAINVDVTFDAAIAIALLFFVSLGRFIMSQRHERAFLFFQRAQEFKETVEGHGHEHREMTLMRHACRTKITHMMGQKRMLTLGLAGRRGLGKTALLRYSLQESNPLAQRQIQSDRDLKDSKKVGHERLRCLRLFVATPTEFAEQVFLMALLERLAQAFNKALIRLLPSVQPFKVEQELNEKRRVLRVSHMVILVLIILTVAINLYFLNVTNRTPVLRQFFPKPDSTATETFSPPRIYTEMRDSLLAELRVQAVLLQDSLGQIDTLLNPKVTKESWNLKSGYDPLQKEFMIQATWDSLKKLRVWPRLDSLRRTSLRYHAIWDSIKTVSARYQAISDSIMLLSGSFPDEEVKFWQSSGWFWFNCVLLFALPFVYWKTREGETRFSERVYSIVRNEIALYERTNALLERLHFQMSFGENRETGLAFSQSGWQLTQKVSKQVQRQVRPYTTMSLIDEFQEYISDAKMYLNDALKMSNPYTDERIQIIIAIDELDKILDTEKLHNMLKSMKAIFEIEDVYYILSISEDALETYRLRHVDTKNEIDSAFTHIIPVPPMDAIGSIAFYVEHHQNWAVDILPAAIVFGGGVPRDMHRLSLIFGTYPSAINLRQCLERLIKEDISACEDMILLNSHLSDEGKQVWLKILAESGFISKEKTEELLGKIEAHTVDDFTKINPCGGDKAKEQFHRLRSLIRGVVIKGFIYHTVQSRPTPSILTSWPQVSELESFIEHLPKDVSLESWLAQLEPLRDAIFELSRNPLRVWDNLTRAKIV